MVVVRAAGGLFGGLIGNIVNCELGGEARDLPWGMVCNGAGAGDSRRHPSQRYEDGLEGLVLLAILWFCTARPKPRMAASGLFLLLYALFR